MSPVPSLPEKQQRVLEAAFGCFAAYGFQRTNMSDIAKAAGMSRPALYLVFENKRDIARGLVRKMKDTSLAIAKKALSRDAPLATRLAEAFHARETAFLEAVEGSAHGQELFDTGLELATDILHEGEAEFSKALQQALRRAGRQGEIDPKAAGLSVPRLTDLLINGAHGQKTGVTSAKILRRRIDDFLQLVLAGLR
jgi:AcrR family transcriptional regulator